MRSLSGAVDRYGVSDEDATAFTEKTPVLLLAEGSRLVLPAGREYC